MKGLIGSLSADTFGWGPDVLLPLTRSLPVGEKDNHHYQ